MIFQKIAIIAALAVAGLAQDISQDDIPSQCTAICAEVVRISQQCDRQYDDDNAELQCICNAANANTLVPTCEACVAQFDVDTDDEDLVNDNDVREVLTRCKFSTTTYNSASASSLASSISFLASSAASASPSVSGAVATTASGNVIAVTAAPASIASQGAGNAAPAPTAAAAIGLGVLGFALGML